MRTIKFRGKRINNGEWVYGFLVKLKDGVFIHIVKTNKYTKTEFTVAVEVRANSVGQFTGLHDKNGKEIYEGDILKTFPIISSDKTSYDSFNVVVRFTSSSWIANGVLGFRQAEISEVIGNSYENPELLTD